MVDVPISRLPVADTLTGAEPVPIVQGGVTKQVTVGQLLNLVVAGAPGALDTLKELADAIGDDPNYGGSIATALAAKADATAVAATYAPLGSPSFTGTQPQWTPSGGAAVNLATADDAAGLALLAGLGVF